MAEQIRMKRTLREEGPYILHVDMVRYVDMVIELVELVIIGLIPMLPIDDW